MNLHSYDVWFLLIIIVLYIYDSSRLLFINEFVFVGSERGWRFAYPQTTWHVLKKYLYIPNPLKPSYLVFTTSWSANRKPSGVHNDAIFNLYLTRLWPLRLLTVVLFIILFIHIPLVLFIQGTEETLISVLILAYMLISAMLFFVYLNRKFFVIGKATFYLLSLELILCPPFAINLVRKLTLRQKVTEDPIRLAGRILKKESFINLLTEIESRIEHNLLFHDEGTVKHVELHEYQQYVQNEIRLAESNS